MPTRFWATARQGRGGPGHGCEVAAPVVVVLPGGALGAAALPGLILVRAGWAGLALLEVGAAALEPPGLAGYTGGLVAAAGDLDALAEAAVRVVRDEVVPDVRMVPQPAAGGHLVHCAAFGRIIVADAAVHRLELDSTLQQLVDVIGVQVELGQEGGQLLVALGLCGPSPTASTDVSPQKCQSNTYVLPLSSPTLAELKSLRTVAGANSDAIVPFG